MQKYPRYSSLIFDIKQITYIVNIYSLTLFFLMITWTLTVESIEYSPSQNVAQIRFRPDSPIRFTAWQFVFLQRIWFTYPDGKVMKNAYSIWSSYEEYEQTWFFSTIVKKSSETGMSAYLTQEIKPGDTIQCTWPLWHFVDPGTSDKYLLISIGSGVTPIVSLYKHLAKAKPSAQIVNIYGERKLQDIIPSIQELFVDSASIHNILYLSQEDSLYAQRKKWHIQDGLSDAFTLLQDNNYIVFLCGKPAMVDEVRGTLAQRWIPKEHIIFEKY